MLIKSINIKQMEKDMIVGKRVFDVRCVLVDLLSKSDGLTLLEIFDKTSIPINRIKSELRMLKNEGMLICGARYIKNNGKGRPENAYKI